MEIGEKAKFDLEKRNGDPLTYTSSNLSSNWQFSSSNHSNLLGLVTMDDSLDTCRDSLRGGTNETMDSNWNPPRGTDFLQIASQIMPQTLSEFPADSSFIERAARFSCFNGGSFGDMSNPYKTSESMNPYCKEEKLVQGSFEVFSADGLKHAVCVQPQMNKQNRTEGSQDVVESVEQCVAIGSLPKERDIVENVRSPEEASKECNVPYEAEVSGSCPKVERSMLEAGGLPSASKGLGAKKRKRVGQVTESNKIQGSPQFQEETAKDDNGPKHKNAKNLSTPSKATKQVKDSSQNSDGAKEDYIHVRARRGQATNSHSLAERVRREKISERMKFLQDLVPGCNKVTGKAVMLDEIINYVQSLQRQVEFLSMKLATVNPQFDLNVEGLLVKDIHQSRGVPSMLPFPPDANMVHAQLHPSQQGLMHAGIPGTGNPLDALRRPTNSQLIAMSGGGYKDSSQLPNMWVDELNNVFQMNFGTNGSFSGQELNGPLTSGHMKVEL